MIRSSIYSIEDYFFLPPCRCNVGLFYFFVDQFLNVGLQIRRDGDLAGLSDQELALEVPHGIPGTGFVLEEFPHFWCGVALDLSKFHEDTGKFFLGGKFGNGVVVVEFLPPVFPGGESENDELVFPEFLVESLKLSVLAIR